MAENYLQHAEHYIRIVAAAQPQARRGSTARAGQDDDDDDDFPPINDRFSSPEPRTNFGQQRKGKPADNTSSSRNPRPAAGDGPGPAGV